MPETQSSRLERYELLDRIAVGGMAEVFRAKASGAHGFEKTLAIKRILPDLARDPEFEQRFINEAKLAVKLSHANIVQVLDFGRFAGSLFIAMEYVDGLDLAHLLRACRAADDKIEVPAALYIAIEIVRGLDFAHRRRVIHRDVSPSNILLSRAGEVKIADFGIAEAVKRKRKQKGSRRIMGKWRYMSPEQAHGDPLTTASDVFSAGAVIYELTTGDKLFPGDEAEDIIANIEGMEITRAAEVRPELPERVDDILARMLERDPEKRPNASDVLRELLELSYESTIVASPLGVADAVEHIVGKPTDGESSDKMDVDMLIRAQLEDNQGRATTVRKTDVGDPDEDLREATGHSVVKRIDSDGITILEIDNTAAAAPAAMGRGRRSSEAPPIDGMEDTGVEQVTEPKEAAGEVEEDELTPIADPRSNRRGWFYGAAIAATALLAGGGVWLAQPGAEPEPPTRLPVVVDNGDAGVPEVKTARLVISSEPVGARVTIDGMLQKELTPLTLDVKPGVQHRVEVELDGFELARMTDLKLEPGDTVRVPFTLRKLRAELRVDSRPQGATVFLGDERLGTTPLIRTDVTPGIGQKLRIVKTDYKDVLRTVDLSHEEPFTLTVPLESSLEYGYVRISLVGKGRTWADVIHRGKKLRNALDPSEIARVPRNIISLPVGRQRIQLVNREANWSKTVTINVPATSRDAPRTIKVEI